MSPPADSDACSSLSTPAFHEGLSFLACKIRQLAWVILRSIPALQWPWRLTLEWVEPCSVLDLEPSCGCVTEIIQLRNWHVGHSRETNLWNATPETRYIACSLCKNALSSLQGLCHFPKVKNPAASEREAATPLSVGAEGLSD